MAADPLPPNAIKAVLGALEGNQPALNEFVDGLDKRIHALDLNNSEEARRNLLLFVGQWAVSVMMTKSDDWTRSVEEAEAALARGDVQEGISSAELRELIIG